MGRLSADHGRVPEGIDNDTQLNPSEVSALLDVNLRTLSSWEEERSSVVSPPWIPWTASTKRLRWGDLQVWIEERYSGEEMGDRRGDRLVRRSVIVEQLGISPATLERWLSGKVAGVEGPPFVKISRSTIRYWEGDLQGWVQAHHKRKAS